MSAIACRPWALIRPMRRGGPAALPDADLARLAHGVDRLPAGGDDSLLAVIGIVFLVLLLLDYLDVIHGLQQPPPLSGLGARLCLALLLPGLVACSTHRLREAQAARPRVEIARTPFFPRAITQCGPAALATILTASGADTTPAALTSEVYLPGRRGSLQSELLASARRHARVAYVLDPSVDGPAGGPGERAAGAGAARTSASRPAPVALRRGHRLRSRARRFLFAQRRPCAPAARRGTFSRHLAARRELGGHRAQARRTAGAGHGAALPRRR